MIDAQTECGEAGRSQERVRNQRKPAVSSSIPRSRLHVKDGMRGCCAGGIGVVVVVVVVMVVQLRWDGRVGEVGVPAPVDC